MDTRTEADTFGLPVDDPPAVYADAAAQPIDQTRATAARAAAKYAWILENQARNMLLSPAWSRVFRCDDLSADQFCDNFYAPGRAVLLGGVARKWPACQQWTPDYLRALLGAAVVDYQSDRTSDADFERNMDAHLRQIPFDQFIDTIIAHPGNGAYITAYSSAKNAAAFAPLHDDMGSLDQVLDDEGTRQAMFWIGPAGTFTPLHHDLTNNLLIQLAGRKRVILAPACETPRLYNDHHVFSEIRDVMAHDVDLARYPKLRDIQQYELILEPGDALFIPIGWWHQLTALDFSVSATCTNFRWPNLGWESHPDDATYAH